MSHINWTPVIVVGGGIALVGGGYLVYRCLFSAQQPPPPPEPKKNKGVLGKVFGWLIGDSATENALDSLGSIFRIPGNVVSVGESMGSAVKWIAIGGGLLVALLIIVFAYRMAIGDTPDIAGGVSQMAQVVPQVQMARMMSQ